MDEIDEANARAAAEEFANLKTAFFDACVALVKAKQIDLLPAEARKLWDDEAARGAKAYENLRNGKYLDQADQRRVTRHIALQG